MLNRFFPFFYVLDRWHRRRFPKYVSNFSQIKLDTIHNLNSLVAKGGIIDNNTVCAFIYNNLVLIGLKFNILCALTDYKRGLW